MTKTLTLLLAMLFTINSFGQAFEGKITYKNSYKSKMTNVTNEQLTAMMGSTQEYYIKKGSYKSVTDGTFFQWQLYVHTDNKLYSKMANSETLFWHDAAVNAEEVLKVDFNKEVMEILGYQCDELVLTCKSGIQKYYFNTKLSVDKELFVDHKYGNWSAFLSKSNSLPLGSMIDNTQFTFENIATEIKKMDIDQAFFELPANSKTMKSPY